MPSSCRFDPYAEASLQAAKNAFSSRRDTVGSVSHAPRPFSPDPALFETAVNMLISFLFASAPIRVSVWVLGGEEIDDSLGRIRISPGVPHNPKPITAVAGIEYTLPR